MKIPNEQKKYFIGKICTIFIVPSNRDFQQENPERYPEQVYKYFVGVVEDITDYGIMLQQSTTGLKSWIFIDHIISIAEEEVEYLTAEDVKVVDKPQQVASTSQLKTDFPNQFPEFNANSPNVDIDALQKIINLTQQDKQNIEKQNDS